MENKDDGKASSGKSKVVIIVILFIVILCLSGYILYDKVFMVHTLEKKECVNEEIANEIVSTPIDSGFSSNNITEIQSLLGYFYDVIISKEGNVYLILTDDQNSDIYKNNIDSLKSKYTLNEIKGYCNTDGELAKEICPNGDSINSIKLDLSNVIAAYDTKDGQEVYGNFITFLMEDGTISRISVGKMLQEGVVEIERNVDNLTNIVTIVQSSTTGVPSGSHRVLAIEKNGTQHILSGYLPK